MIIFKEKKNQMLLFSNFNKKFHYKTNKTFHYKTNKILANGNATINYFNTRNIPQTLS